MKFIILISCIFVFSVSYLNKKQKRNDLESFLGTWKGTSLCQVKNSPCHDESVVYYITKGNTADSCNILANKIVNGAEEEMGIVACRFDKTNNELSSAADNALWNFKLKEGKLHGTLVLRNSLYRIIEASRVK